MCERAHCALRPCMHQAPCAYRCAKCKVFENSHALAIGCRPHRTATQTETVTLWVLCGVRMPLCIVWRPPNVPPLSNAHAWAQTSSNYLIITQNKPNKCKRVRITCCALHSCKLRCKWHSLNSKHQHISYVNWYVNKYVSGCMRNS